jgi:menaquinone-9 beta-reductase
LDSYDVAIVGGGPAGSSCARTLAQAGVSVVVLDQRDFPRDKVCAGWITPQVVQSLDLSLADYASGRVLQPISAFAVGVIGQSELVVDYERVISYAIRRCEFDDYLLRRSGAALRLGVAVRKFRFEQNQWVIDDSVCARILVGAGGHFCPVARHLGAAVGRTESAIYAQEAEFCIAGTTSHCAIRAERPELYFCPDLRGYAWCLRKGDYFNIGLGREDNHGLAERLHSFWTWLRASERVPDCAPPHFKGHAYLLYPLPWRRCVADHALLIGDAAGLAYEHSGEGIRPAIESGMMAAQVILNTRRSDRRSAFETYRSLLEARYGRREVSARAPTMAGPWRQAIGRRLLGQRPFVRHVVLDRWFLHRADAALRH